MKIPLLLVAIAAGTALTLSPAHAQDRNQPDFSTLDADGDGLVTMDEIQAAGAARFDDADADGNGALSEAELIASIQARASDRAARMAERMLSRLDANDDGVLQQEEIADRAGDRLMRRFERADANNDGAISAAEFEEASEGRGRGRDGKGHRGGRG